MSGRTVWLASYPKSGNTWVRAVVTALGTDDRLFSVSNLASGGQPFQLLPALAALGVDPRWLDDDEIAATRARLITHVDAGASDAVLLRKTHERFRTGAVGAEPFPLAATRAAILVVRDPRDVACSYAHFFDIALDDAIEAMARDGGSPDADAARAQSAQPWGTWSSHALSWLDDLPFDVHVVRYEDLLRNAAATLQPVFDAVGIACTTATLDDAVERTRFERLQASERERGFRETSPRTRQFFRSGRGGGWRDELAADQVAAIEADHGEVMSRLGYELTTREADRTALARSRRAERDAPRGNTLPAWLDLHVRDGALPSELPDAARPRPFIQVAGTQALVRFRNGTGVWVCDGHDVVVDRGDAASDAVGWLVQGWGVTLAMLQRGLLSLHASTVEVGGRVVAIAGGRGAGKSTTAMGLRGRGHALQCDDVTVVQLRDDGAWTTPYWRNVHLLEDAATALGLDFDALPVLGEHRIKAAFRPEEPPERPRRIDTIVVLSPSDVDLVTVSRPVGAARLATLVDHTSRDGIAPLVLGQEAYFARVAALADAVPVAVVERPSDAWSLDAVLDAIERLT